MLYYVVLTIQSVLMFEVINHIQICTSRIHLFHPSKANYLLTKAATVQKDAINYELNFIYWIYFYYNKPIYLKMKVLAKNSKIKLILLNELSNIMNHQIKKCL